jgi:hypothetical protein
MFLNYKGKALQLWTQLLLGTQLVNSQYPYIGKWSSKIVKPTGKTLCFLLDAYSHAEFYLSVNLTTGDQGGNVIGSTTVFNVSDQAEQRFSLRTELPLKDFVDGMTSSIQLVVFLSANFVLNDVSYEQTSCQRSTDSKFVFKSILLNIINPKFTALNTQCDKKTE